MQKTLLSLAHSSTKDAILALEELKTADIKARKAAKPSAKSKWTKRINATTQIITSLKKARMGVRSLPKRVA